MSKSNENINNEKVIKINDAVFYKYVKVDSYYCISGSFPDILTDLLSHLFV